MEELELMTVLFRDTEILVLGTLISGETTAVLEILDKESMLVENVLFWTSRPITVLLRDTEVLVIGTWVRSVIVPLMGTASVGVGPLVSEKTTVVL